MFEFNFEKSPFFKKSKWKLSPFLNSCHFLKCLFLVIFLLFFVLFVIGFLTGDLEDVSLSRILGVSLLMLVMASFFHLLDLFLKTEEEKSVFSINSSKEKNLASFLSFKSSKSVFDAINWAKSHGFKEIDSDLVLYFLLKNNPKLNFVFYRILVSPERVKSNLLKSLKKKSVGIKKIILGKKKQVNYSKDFYEVFQEAFRRASKKNHKSIQVGDILFALSKTNVFLKELILNNNIKPEDIDEIVKWIEFFEKEREERRKWWEYKNLMKKRCLGREFSSAYTLNLDEYSINISDILRRRNFRSFFGHESELSVMERVLSREKINNVLLIGKPGSGRKSIVSKFAKKSFFGDSLPELNYKRIVKLNFSTLTSRIQSVEELESVLDKIFKEAIYAGNIILVIEDIHNYVGEKIKPGVFDISSVIAPYLRMPGFQIIATTTYFDFYNNLEKKPSFSNLFEKVRVSEISPEQTLSVLEDLIPSLEAKYSVFVSYSALRDIVSYTNQYLPALPFPKKAQDILDEALIMLRSSGKKVLTSEYVSKIVSEKSRIPVGEAKTEEKEKLLNLEKLIHKRIVDQKNAVNGICSALRRARSEIKTRKGPMGSFLFLGPTGVGKTETSKALSEIYFGSEEKMIRLDMSEFQQAKDISRIIGSKEEEGFLTSKVKEDPFSLVLLDEIEKAYPDILNIFLQILDEGYVTDGMGRKVSFKNTIIIATSNAGYKMILEYIGRNADWDSVKNNLLNRLFSEGVFRPEFINRFDGVVVFKPLSDDDLMNICQLQLNDLKENLSKKEIDFEETEELKRKIVDLSYNPQFGAREMKRVIQDKIENSLAKALLSGSLKKGKKVKVEPKNFNLIIN
jgi:ATP-dependent Clp protease ATP-binding subunit ClpC